MRTILRPAPRIALALLAVGATSTCIHTATAQMMGDGMNGMTKANSIIAGWPMDARTAAKKVINRYGQPNEATPSRLIWFNNGPWKRTVASRTSIPHLFPAKHPDSMEQFIDYRVPLGKYDDLARFDGSVNVDRTRGEMSARCDTDAHNFLALNLSHDIITNRRSVAGARAFYGRAVKMEMGGMIHPYLMGLRFSPRPGMSSDADKSTIKM